MATKWHVFVILLCDRWFFTWQCNILVLRPCAYSVWQPPCKQTEKMDDWHSWNCSLSVLQMVGQRSNWEPLSPVLCHKQNLQSLWNQEYQWDVWLKAGQVWPQRQMFLVRVYYVSAVCVTLNMGQLTGSTFLFSFENNFEVYYHT